MRFSSFVRAWLNWLLCLGMLITFTTPAGSSTFLSIYYTSIPYSQDFEAGYLPYEWVLQVTNQGRERVIPAYFPGSGVYSVVLDDAVPGGSVSTAAIMLPLNLKHESQVSLSFWYKSYVEETQAGDGVFISKDGSSWKRIFIFDPAASDWVNVQIDLDMEASAYNEPFNEHYWLKFQFSGTEPAPDDGYAIDNVSLQRPATTSSLQGTIYSLPNDATPLVGATIKIYSGSILLFTEISDATGHYGPVWLAPANYRVEINAPFHPPLKQIVTIPSAQNFTQDFILYWPTYFPYILN